MPAPSPASWAPLLRREGLYSSHLTKWRRQRDEAARGGFDKPRGRKPTPAAEVEAAKLREENAKLKKELAAAHMVIDVQKNVSALLGIALESAEPRITQ
ncbi:MAG: transposase [Candidatus Nephthysia bennettiae]|nr:transposase [Candidatus Dormibacteraeota bacterium]PZR87258.1 MAG: transposase [Candidatus Dormibacteraeota bacterium]